MQVTVEATGALERTMKVRVPAADIEQEISERLKRMGKTARLKGFRAGKVPQKVVQQHYGSQVRQEVLSDVLQRSYQQALRQEELLPVGRPRIEPDAIANGEDFSYTAVFEVFPQVEFQQIEKLPLENPQVEVTDADVDRMLENLRRQRSTWEAAERAAAEGDRVTVDFLGTLDGEPFDGGEGQDLPIVLGEGTMLEDFEKALYGTSAGDEKTVDLTFPENYHHEPLRNQQAQFKVTVKNVEQRLLPEIDDAFAEKLGVPEGGVAALREQILENLKRELNARLSTFMTRQALQRLAEANPVEVPEGLVSDEIRVLQQDSMRRLGIEDPEQAPPEDAFRDTAQKRVALGLLIREIVQREKLSPDPKRVSAHIANIASGYDRPEEVVRYYQSEPRLRNQAEMAVLEQQVAEWLAQRAEITDKPVSFQEFMGE